MRIRPALERGDKVGGVLLCKDSCGEKLRVQFRAEVLIRLFRLEWRPLPILCEGFQNLLSVVREVHDHHILLAVVAAVQAGYSLYRIAVHDWLVEKHACE